MKEEQRYFCFVYINFALFMFPLNGLIFRSDSSLHYVKYLKLLSLLLLFFLICRFTLYFTCILNSAKSDSTFSV